MELILASLAGLSVALLAVGATRRTPATMVRHRIRSMATEEVAPKDRSFAERVLSPLAAQVARAVAAMMPGGVLRSVAARLETAGMAVPASRFITWWLGGGVLLPVAVLLLVIGTGRGAGVTGFLALGAWLVLGGWLPWMMLGRRGRARTEAIDRSLSDAMDLIVTNVESGVGLQSALINVAQKSEGPLAEDLRRVIREIGLGRPRDEALEGMARRSGSREMALFARSISQAERNGIPIARVLRGQAAEFRERRRQAARERANTFPLRITILTVMFIFPTLFLLILGPVALNVLDHFNK